ncbi:MAG: glycerophosphodiester phosphodiesterase family protein [Anaerolineales bacterium]
MLPKKKSPNIAGLRRPAIFAHRGSSAYAPENTLAAFCLAIEQGADGIELDAILSADSQVIVIHDQTADRTTNGTGRVNRLTLTELQTLDAGSHFDASFKGERIPSLAEVFNTFGNHIFINVELKNYASPTDDLPDRVVELVRKYAFKETILISSFNPVALLRVHYLMPEIPLGLLTIRGKKGAIFRSWLGRLVPHQVIQPAWTDVNPSLVADNHHHGCSIFPYTINDPIVMQHLFKIGVDGIYTDNPPSALKVLAEINRG